MKPVRKKRERKVYEPPPRTYDPRANGALCDKCPLKDQMNAVPCKPPTGKAKLIILGEAPGPLDEVRGEYFVGPSGEELDAGFRHYGIPRKAVHLNNCLQCKPNKNLSIGQWKKATECCWPRLEKELCQSGAKTVLGLGKWSQWVLFGKTDPIHDWCGSPYPLTSPFCGTTTQSTKKDTCEDMPTDTEKAGKRTGSSRKKKKKEKPLQQFHAIALVTYHPAAALRGKRVLLEVLFTHLERAWKISCGLLEDWKWPAIYANDDTEAVEALRKIWEGVRKGKIKRLGLDIETNGSNPCLDSMTKVGIASHEASVSLSWPLCSDAVDLVRSILAHPVAKAAHNGTHDLIGLEKEGFEVNGYAYDTIIQHAVWCPPLLHRLQFACCTEFHMPAWKKEFKVSGEEKGLERFLKADPVELGIYNAKDAYMTLLLSYALEDRLRKDVENWEELYAIRLELSLYSKEMRQLGVRCDRTNLKEHLRFFLRCRKQAGGEFRKLARQVGYKKYAKLNPSSTQQMKEFFFGFLKIKSTKFSPKTGQPSLDEKALQAMVAHPNEVAAKASQVLLRFRRWSKLVSMTRELWNRKIEVIHADGQCWGTKTGRWAYKDPNLTTIPKPKYKKSDKVEADGTRKNVLVAPGLRDVIAARPGLQMAEADFCVDPQTKVLLADLTWKKAGELTEGEVLVGFPEEFRKEKHVFSPSVLERKKEIVRASYRIITNIGEITVSAEHRLACCGKVGMVNKPRHWVQAQHLMVGDKLSFMVAPWEVERSYEAGWLAGIFDGEGWAAGSSVAVGQNEGPTLQRIRDALRERGFEFAENRNKSGCTRLQLTGNSAGLRLLGSIRPKRLLDKSESVWVGRQTWGKRTPQATIERIEYLGKQKVVALQTSTKTFIANGFLSHNSQLELRILAYMTGDDLLIQWYDQGIDVHQENAKRWFGTENPGKFQRGFAKTLVYAMNYGGSAKTIWSNLVVDCPGLQLSDIERYLKLWYMYHPKIATWQQQLMAQVRKDGFVKIPFTGKIVHFFGDEPDPPKVYNPPIQGTASYLIDRAIRGVWPLLRRDEGENLLLQVHDALIGESPQPKRLARLIVEKMEEPVELNGRRIVFPADVKIGPNWGSLKEVERAVLLS